MILLQYIHLDYYKSTGYHFKYLTVSEYYIERLGDTCLERIQLSWSIQDLGESQRMGNLFRVAANLQHTLAQNT